MTLKDLVAATLVLSLAAVPVHAQAQAPTVVDRTEIEQALAQRVQGDDAARDSIRHLLQRDDVRSMANGMGLDVRRAESAVATLEGNELEQVAKRAALADEALTGGRTTTINISLVAALLIIIIVILLVK